MNWKHSNPFVVIVIPKLKGIWECISPNKELKALNETNGRCVFFFQIFTTVPLVFMLIKTKIKIEYNMFNDTVCLIKYVFLTKQRIITYFL